MEKEETELMHQELAIARYQLADNILASEHAGEIVTGLHTLTMLYLDQAKQLSKSKKKKDKKLAKKMKFVADEFYTITMCAIYNKHDQRNG